jgi:hypothetical protein
MTFRSKAVSVAVVTLKQIGAPHVKRSETVPPYWMYISLSFALSAFFAIRINLRLK